MVRKEQDHISVSMIRLLSVNQIEQAKSGHPGMPLGVADAAYVLWTQFLRYQPTDPDWVARDRFVLSSGHASSLLYSLLHLAGFDLSLDDLRCFRQWDSRTPGHPERGLTPGVEVTTGPLGQGLANGVGMALGLRMLEDRFSSPAFPGLGARVWTLASDGDMMEGISSEAASLAGHLSLENLIVIYDSNCVTIDGSTALTFSEDVAGRFESFGWRVLRVDGHDHSGLNAAYQEAQPTSKKPVLIISKSLMAKHVPGREGDFRLHGSPVGPEGVAGLKKTLGLDNLEPFEVPEEAYIPFQEHAAAVKTEMINGKTPCYSGDRQNPTPPSNFDQCLENHYPTIFRKSSRGSWEMREGNTGRFGIALNEAARHAPWLVGGSAGSFPASSNKAWIENSEAVTADNYSGCNIHLEF